MSFGAGLATAAVFIAGGLAIWGFNHEKESTRRTAIELCIGIEDDSKRMDCARDMGADD